MRRISDGASEASAPLIAEQEKEILQRKHEKDFATAAAMEKEIARAFSDESRNSYLAHAAILHSEKPEYPREARRCRLTGKGIFALQIDTQSGNVTAVRAFQSTGHRLLDEAAIAALQKWKFAPHNVSYAKLPITFSLER